MIDRIIKVNLGSEGVPPLVKITQGDTQWRFAFQVYWNNQRYTIPTGSTAILSGRKPDGHGVELSGSISSNSVYVSCTAQFTAVSGLVPCTLQLFDSAGKLVNSCPVLFACAPDAKGGAEVSASDLSAYEELLASVQQLLADYNAAGAVPGYVSAWLAENITNPDSPPVDASLTVTGAAADAKAAGLAINQLGSSLFVDVASTVVFIVGAINSSSGADSASASSTRLRTLDSLLGNIVKISVSAGYKYMLFGYDGSTYKGTWRGSAFAKSANWLTADTDLTQLPATYTYRIVFSKSDDTALSPSDVSNNLTLYSIADRTLSRLGRAADAYATGAAFGRVTEPTANLYNGSLPRTKAAGGNGLINLGIIDEVQFTRQIYPAGTYSGVVNISSDASGSTCKIAFTKEKTYSDSNTIVAFTIQKDHDYYFTFVGIHRQFKIILLSFKCFLIPIKTHMPNFACRGKTT